MVESTSSPQVQPSKLRCARPALLTAQWVVNASCSYVAVPAAAPFMLLV